MNNSDLYRRATLLSDSESTYQLETLANISQKATCVPAKTFADKPKDKPELEKLSTQLKQLDKAIESHENKQNKRKIDRERVLQKMESMLPEGYGICLTGGESQYQEEVEKGVELDPEDIVVGSVWECVDNNNGIHLTRGKEYTVSRLDEDGDPCFENDVISDTWVKEDFLASFKRVA